MRCGEDQVFFTGYYRETRDVFFNIISRGLSITLATQSLNSHGGMSFFLKCLESCVKST